MTRRRGQDRLTGACTPGRGPTLSACGAVAVLWLSVVLAAPALASRAAPEPAPAVPAAPADAGRDSLKVEIRRYSALIASLRDSLDTGKGEIRLSDEQRARLENSVGEISKVIERISTELGRMDFEVKNNTISLLDDAGEGIVITIPPNLDEHLSQGFEALSNLLATELPDTVRMEAERRLSWLGRPPAPPKHARRVVQGNIVKIGDDLLVPWGEDVRGDVVVVAGDAEIQGRIDGNVVVVMGSLQLGETAEVTGQVVTVGGRLDRDEGATAGSVTVIDPMGARRGWAPSALLGGGLRGFLVSQTLFLLMLAVAMLGAAAAPEARFRAVQLRLTGRPAAALGVGLVTAVVGHLVALVLIGALVLTVIGIPVALLVWFALVVAGVLATAVTAAALGERLCGGMGRACPSRWLAVLVGMAMLHAVSFLGAALGLVAGGGFLATTVAMVGIVIKAAAYLCGLGALIGTRFGTAKVPAAPAAEPA